MIGTLAFLFPLTVWYRYSARIASSGGLFAFVEAAAGRRLALLQAGFWIVSYFLYLIYTVPYIVYDLLPTIFPQLVQYRFGLDILLALLIAAVMLSPLIVVLGTLVAIAVSQVVIALFLAATTLGSLGLPASSFIGHGNFIAVLAGGGKTSALYVCTSLPLFLAGEVRGGARTVQRSLAWAFPAVGALAVIAVFPLASAGRSVSDASIPGVALVQATSARGLAWLIGLGVAISVCGLIFAEFLALSRLLATITARPSRLLVAITVVLFLVGSAISLIDPARAYSVLLKPSLIALWVSQLIVVAVYPWFAARTANLRPADLGLAAAASLLMGFSLYQAVTSGAAT